MPSPGASPQQARERTVVDLPPSVAPPFEVYVNGVRQEQGRDYRVAGSTLVFERSLRSEGRLGFWRWLSLFLGVAGTYRQNDVVDVVYDLGGRRHVATGLPYRSEGEERSRPGRGASRLGGGEGRSRPRGG